MNIHCESSPSSAKVKGWTLVGDKGPEEGKLGEGLVHGDVIIGVAERDCGFPWNIGKLPRLGDGGWVTPTLMGTVDITVTAEALALPEASGVFKSELPSFL
jgi:hypothetical protein